MMGVKTAEPKLFYLFSLDDKVPHDHLLRLIAENVDFSFVYGLPVPIIAVPDSLLGVCVSNP